MDPGHFLTGSGSKIPMPKLKKENQPPVKPKLTTYITTTNYIGDNPGAVNIIEKDIKKVKPQKPVNLKTTASNSVPNLVKSTSLTTSKTINSKVPATATGVKRTATMTESTDAPATKQSKAAPKSVFPYKAKNWELKARLAECEGWVIDLRSKCTDLESQFNDNTEELQKAKSSIGELNTEKNALQDEIGDLKCQKSALENDLRSVTEKYEKLCEDSKQFLSRIERLEEAVSQKDSQISTLQTDQNQLRNELVVKDSNLSELRFTVEDLEFKVKRQLTQIQDLEQSVDRLCRENLELNTRLKLRDDEVAMLQENWEKAQMEIRVKCATMNILEAECVKSGETIMNMQNEITKGKSDNITLRGELEQAKTELAEKRTSEELLTATCDELKKKLCESEKLRRFLHNAVQDLKGNIRVFCRVRPPISSEKENSIPLCSINFPDEGSLEISKGDPFTGSNSAMSRPKFVKHEFSFDRVFNPTATQEDIFDELSQLVQSALDGYNVCVFAYGQTGSGKTYTMEGENSKDLRGMIPRTVDHIFKSLKELESIGWEYTVEVSFLEIYNEIIRDLLRNDKEGSSLKIMQVDGKTNEVTIPGLTVMKVDSYEDLDRLYLLAHQNRAVAYTSCNERSSRSHSVTRIKVSGTHHGRGERCYGSLYLVDLAGSERLNEPMSDPRFREMKNINKSLSELGNVILGLLQKQEYIPYRNSKLTHLLQPALGGSSKTLMLVNISPAEHCLQETLCSLRFAEKVNKVKMGTTKKRIIYDNAILK